MAIQQTQRHCPICKKPVLAQRQLPNRWIHGILSFCTIWWFGVWVEAEQSMPALRCTTCGHAFGTEREFSVASAIIKSVGISFILIFVLLCFAIALDRFS